jgi:hypothetical protein
MAWNDAVARQHFSKRGLAPDAISGGAPLLVVVGETGVGKSTFTNYLVGRELAFDVGHGARSLTAQCQVEYSRAHGAYVMDTPGFGDVRPSSSLTDATIATIIMNAIHLTGCRDVRYLCVDRQIARNTKRLETSVSRLVLMLQKFYPASPLRKVYFAFRPSKGELSPRACRELNEDQLRRLTRTLDDSFTGHAVRPANLVPIVAHWEDDAFVRVSCEMTDLARIFSTTANPHAWRVEKCGTCGCNDDLRKSMLICKEHLEPRELVDTYHGMCRWGHCDHTYHREVEEDFPCARNPSFCDTAHLPRPY